MIIKVKYLLKGEFLSVREIYEIDENFNENIISSLFKDELTNLYLEFQTCEAKKVLTVLNDSQKRIFSKAYDFREFINLEES